MENLLGNRLKNQTAEIRACTPSPSHAVPKLDRDKFPGSL